MSFCTLSVKKGASLKLRKKKKQLGFHLNAAKPTQFSAKWPRLRKQISIFFFFFYETVSASCNQATFLIFEPCPHYLSDWKELANVKQAYRMHCDLARS